MKRKGKSHRHNTKGEDLDRFGVKGGDLINIHIKKEVYWAPTTDEPTTRGGTFTV